MKIYSYYGITDFIICCGYKGYLIKEYFANYSLHTSDVTFHLGEGRMEVHRRQAEPWRVTLIDTGESTLTAGRLARVRDHLRDDIFCFTYGDGLSNVNIPALVDHHRKTGLLATLTAVQPPGRYGALEITGDKVHNFNEKADGEHSWINGGFFVLNPSVIDLIEGDNVMWEQQPLQHLAAHGQLSAFKHHGFWQSMDTLRDRQLLEQLWANGKAPWKVW